MMDGREIRLQRLFGDGKVVIIAADHGMFDGPLPGLEDLPATVAGINPAVDAVLLAPGMLRHCGPFFAAPRRPLAVIRLNWNSVYCFQWGYRAAVSADCYRAEEAFREGMDVALVSLTLHTGSEERDARNVTIFSCLVAEVHALGLPVIGEYFPSGHLEMSPQELHEDVRIGSRIAAELGADAIKTFYTHDFAAVTSTCPVPVLGLGAEKLPSPLDALRLAAAEVAAGAGGVVFGRNALQVPDPHAFQAALLEVVKHRRRPGASRRGPPSDLGGIRHARAAPPESRPPALTLELYETLAPDLRAGREGWLREQVLPALQTQADVVFDRAVYRRRDVEAAVAALEGLGVDALVVVCLTYSPSQFALPALQRAGLPIIVWNTQELWAVDDSFSGQEMVNNHGVHGTQDLGNVLLRSGVPFHYVTSHLRDGLAELGDCLVAAAATQRLRRARLGLLGYPSPVWATSPSTPHNLPLPSAASGRRSRSRNTWSAPPVPPPRPSLLWSPTIALSMR